MTKQNYKKLAINYVLFPGLSNNSYFSIIIDVVSKETGVLKEHMCSSMRIRKVVSARHICFYMMRKFIKSENKSTKVSYQVIGNHFPYKVFGKSRPRDHATVMYGCTAAQNDIDTDPEYARTCDRIQEKLESSKIFK